MFRVESDGMNTIRLQPLTLLYIAPPSTLLFRVHHHSALWNSWNFSITLRSQIVIATNFSIDVLAWLLRCGWKDTDKSHKKSWRASHTYNTELLSAHYMLHPFLQWSNIMMWDRFLRDERDWIIFKTLFPFPSFIKLDDFERILLFRLFGPISRI